MPGSKLNEVLQEISNLEVINWEKALEQACNDQDFLNEVLQDLLTEINEAENELSESIKNCIHDDVRKAAHRIKGSASYLHCEKLRDVSKSLQFLAQANGNWDDIKDLHKLFLQCANELREKIKEKEN